MGAFNFFAFLFVVIMFIKNSVSFFIWTVGGRKLEAAVFYALGVALIVAGILIIVAVIVFASRREVRRGRVKGAGVIMIGPVPIIFGTDKESVKTVLLLAIALTVVVIFAMIIYYLVLR